jgi:hypothetical protein
MTVLLQAAAGLVNLASAQPASFAQSTKQSISKPVQPKQRVSAATLNELADEAIASDTVLAKPRIELVESERSLYVDLRPVPLDYIGSPKNDVVVPLEAAVRIRVLRRDLQKCFPRDKFWVDSVQDVESAISHALEQIERPHTAGAGSVGTTQSNSIQQSFARLQASVAEYATEHGLSVKQSKDPAPGFVVAVKFDPANVHVLVMPYLAYLMCRRFGTPLAGQWTELSEGNHKMSGKYHYVANWPPRLGGRDENNFEVLENGDRIVFRPKGDQ